MTLMELIQILIYLLHSFVKKSESAVPDQKQPCGRTFVDSSGSLTSPNYPSSYPPNLNCQWSIRAPPGVDIDLELSPFEIWTLPGYPCRDFLQLRGGNLPSHKRCGLNFFKEKLASSSNEVNITFRSDSIGEGSGFKLTWRLDPHQMFLYQKSKADNKTSKFASLSRKMSRTSSSSKISSAFNTRKKYETTISELQTSTERKKEETKLVTTSTNVDAHTIDEGRKKQLSEASNIEQQREEKSKRLSLLDITLIVLVTVFLCCLLGELIYRKKKRVSEVSSAEDIDDKYKYHDPESIGLYRLPSMLQNPESEVDEVSKHSSSYSEASYMEPVNSLWPIACHVEAMEEEKDDEDVIYYSFGAKYSNIHDENNAK